MNVVPTMVNNVVDGTRPMNWAGGRHECGPYDGEQCRGWNSPNELGGRTP